MNYQLRPCRNGRGERVRLARSAWRPAKHIFAAYTLRRATLCTSIVQRQIVENRGEVRRETPRTATATVALPNHFDHAPGQIISNQCFWSKRPANGENPNPALSQCVAASRSDKILKKPERPQPSSASRLRVSSPFVVKKPRPVKVGQSESNRFGWPGCRSKSMQSLQNEQLAE